MLRSCVWLLNELVVRKAIATFSGTVGARRCDVSGRVAGIILMIARILVLHTAKHGEVRLLA